MTSNPDGHTCSTADDYCRITGLTNGTRYTFPVAANNAVGPGAAAGSNSVLIPKSAQTAKVRVATRVKFKGKTVLVKAPVITSAGQCATATASVTPAGKRFAKVAHKRSGKIIIRAKGRLALFVRVTLTAPATAEFRPFTYSKTLRTTVR